MKNKEIRSNYEKRTAQLIEQSYDSFGITMRIVEIRDEEKYTLYLAELALGTPLDKVINKDKDIAMMTASINGKAEIIAPYPGTSLFAIRLPYQEEAALKQIKYYKELEEKAKESVEEIKTENNDEKKIGIREFFALFFYMFSELFKTVGDYIMGRKREKLRQ